MGFSGGGSNVLLPHTHDGTVSQDGGPLNFGNVTQSQSAQGEVFYSDGVHLQQLAYPGVPAGETLTAVAASTAPSWASAASGAATILIDHQELLVATNNITSTFAAVNQSDISSIFAVLNGVKGTANVEIRCQVNGITTGTYGQEVIQQYGATLGNWAGAGATGWSVIFNNQGDVFYGEIKISCNTVNDTLQARWGGGTEQTQVMTQCDNSTAAQTSFTEVKFYPTGGNFLAGTTLSVYKVEI